MAETPTAFLSDQRTTNEMPLDTMRTKFLLRALLLSCFAFQSSDQPFPQSAKKKEKMNMRRFPTKGLIITKHQSNDRVLVFS
jgi:hypothetical protein